MATRSNRLLVPAEKSCGLCSTASTPEPPSAPWPWKRTPMRRDGSAAARRTSARSRAGPSGSAQSTGTVIRPHRSAGSSGASGQAAQAMRAPGGFWGRACAGPGSARPSRVAARAPSAVSRSLIDRPFPAASGLVERDSVQERLPPGAVLGVVVGAVGDGDRVVGARVLAGDVVAEVVERCGVSGVCQRVHDNGAVPRTGTAPVPDDMRSDESGPAGDHEGAHARHRRNGRW